MLKISKDLKSHLNKVDSRNCDDDDDDDSDDQRQNVWRIRAKNAINSVKALVLSIFMPTVVLSMCQSNVKFYVDTGSEVNVMDEKSYNKLALRPKLNRCSKILFGYSSQTPTQIKTIGELTTRVLCGREYRSSNLLSYKSAIELKVMNPIRTVSTNEEYRRKVPKSIHLQIRDQRYRTRSKAQRYERGSSLHGRELGQQSDSARKTSHADGR